ncbi:MAG: hypothetical protein B7Z78_07100 [Rhodospirillales bacterium 20-60-12]|nr:MAG: hypothetical protein B7Z78_07100 [Rhodospirillales bacterium 20-60-12]
MRITANIKLVPFVQNYKRELVAQPREVRGYSPPSALVNLSLAKCDINQVSLSGLRHALIQAISH